MLQATTARGAMSQILVKNLSGLLFDMKHLMYFLVSTKNRKSNILEEVCDWVAQVLFARKFIGAFAPLFFGNRSIHSARVDMIGISTSQEGL